MQSLTNVGYPRNLSFISKRLNGYSRNTIRGLAVANTTAQAGQTIVYDLPNNAIVDLSTLQMFFQGSTTSSAGACSFPKNIEQCISRLEFEINGQLVSTSCPYLEVLYSILYDTTTGYDGKMRRNVLNNAGDQAIPTANVSNKYLAISNFLSFVGSVHPSCVNTAQLGNCRLRITLASPNVLIQSGDCSGANFSFNNIMFSVDVLDIQDGIFHDIHNRYLASGNSYEYNFLNYYSFTTATTGSFAGSLKFSLSSQSLNRAWGCYVHAAPHKIKSIGGVSNGGSAAFDPIRKDSSYFTRLSGGQAGTTVEYDAGSVTYKMKDFQFNVNNIFSPNYLCLPEYGHALMNAAYNYNYSTAEGGDPNLNSLATWLGSYFVAHTKFDHGSDGVSLISGINTSGNVSQCYLNTNGEGWTITGTTPGNVMGIVFCECTASLLVSANRMLQVIF